MAFWSQRPSFTYFMWSIQDEGVLVIRLSLISEGWKRSRLKRFLSKGWMTWVWRLLIRASFKRHKSWAEPMVPFYDPDDWIMWRTSLCMEASNVYWKTFPSESVSAGIELVWLSTAAGDVSHGYLTRTWGGRIIIYCVSNDFFLPPSYTWLWADHVC